MYYPSIIKSEERRMLKLHGQKFESYARSTPAFFPKLSLLNEPKEYIAYPKIFKKHLFDALCFIWALGILEIIEALHESGILPVYISLY